MKTSEMRNKLIELMDKNTEIPELVFWTDKLFYIIDINEYGEKFLKIDKKESKKFKITFLEDKLILSSNKFKKKLNINEEIKKLRWRIYPQQNEGYTFIGRFENFDSLELYFQQIIEKLPGSVYWKDVEGRYLGCNRFVVEMAGLSSVKDIIGKTDFDMPWKERALEIRSTDMNVMQSEKLIEIEEAPTIKNGKQLIMLSSKQPLFDARRKVVGIIGTSLDISELKKAQKNAEAASRSKSEFIANMNHDIRTPLAGMIGMAETIVESTEDLHLRECAQDIKKAGQSLLEFANNILEISQLEMQNILKQPQAINLKKVAQSLKELFTPSLVMKKINFTFNYDDHIPIHLVGYVAYIRRILINLLSNAIKFTHTGKIILSIRHIKTKKEKVFVEFKISDTGIGIPKDQLEAIFEPFKKLTFSHQNIYKGNGLGLYIVKQFVEKLEGQINVQSKLGKGSVFTIILPFIYNKEKTIADNAVLEKTVSSSPKVFFDYTPRILVVEDDEISSKIILNFLKKLNCKVDLAISAQTAMRKIKDNHYNLIYMDIGLPDKDGAEVTQEIRRLEKEKGQTPAPIIALTAHVDESDKEKYLARGLTQVLNKPISKATLQQHIEHYLKDIPKSSSIENKSVAVQTSKNDLQVMLSAMFRKEIIAKLPEIEKLYQFKQWQELKLIIHKLNGSASYCGNPRLKSALSDLEKSLSGEQQKFSIISRCIEICLAEIEHFLAL